MGFAPIKVTAARRRERVAEAVASLRFETAPGAQMQIDFRAKVVRIAGALVRVHLLVAVRCNSRRILPQGRVAQTVTFHPGYLQFCRDWDVVPRSCAPYRARTTRRRRPR